jgi:hypothetical protein
MRQISSSQTGMDDVEVRMNTVESRYSFGDIAPHFLQRPFRSPTAMYKLKPSGRFFSFLVGHHKILLHGRGQRGWIQTGEPEGFR